MTRIRAFVEIDGRTVIAGEAHINVRRGRLTSTFSYDRAYLASPGAYAVDPAVPLATGAWPLAHGLPRAFGDASPDRWGRSLIARRLRAQSVTGERLVRSFDDRDYLLGVSDQTRQGALRFKTGSDETFQHPSTDVPKLIALPSLLHAAQAVAHDDSDNLEAIKTLLDAGTGSLGGARPKASVRDADHLMIAKFPHPGDGWDVIRWEKTALDLAEAAGITVPKRRLVTVGEHPVLLLHRFDRENTRRIGYISAMTLLEAHDGEPHDYTEIAEALPEHSAATIADLNELWRRIAFFIAIHNTDDHLRNHGFLRRAAGWALAPAFDVNPNPQLATQRITGVGGAAHPVEEVSALLAYADSFALTQAQAHSILSEVRTAAQEWPTVAHHNGIPPAEITRFRPTLEATIEALSTPHRN